MIAEHERVVLTVDMDNHGLKTGDVGTVVHVFSEGKAYVVEFLTLQGETVAVPTLPAEAIRPIATDEVASARSIDRLAS